MTWNTDYSHPLAVRIRKQLVEAISEYNLLEEGDKLAVCVSGGKDSSVLLALLAEIAKRAPYQFSVEAVMLDQGHPGFDPMPFSKWVESLGVPFHLLKKDTFSIVKEKVKDGVYCSLCSRLRRGILYEFTFANGFTKMALGHHREDMNETLMMNLFFTGKIASMPPKLKSDDGRNILIRPLVYVAENDIRELAQAWGFPIIPCNLCGSQAGMKRQKVKKLLADLEKEIPYLPNSMINAQSNVHISQLRDQALWDFNGLSKEKPKREAGVDPISLEPIL
jgi:tRNA 2-thiocytidine biosynthesis protein TtcA